MKNNVPGMFQKRVFFDFFHVFFEVSKPLPTKTMKRFYVDKSKLLWDYGYFGLGHVPDHNPRTDPRLGLSRGGHSLKSLKNILKSEPPILRNSKVSVAKIIFF